MARSQARVSKVVTFTSDGGEGVEAAVGAEGSPIDLRHAAFQQGPLLAERGRTLQRLKKSAKVFSTGIERAQEQIAKSFDKLRVSLASLIDQTDVVQDIAQIRGRDLPIIESLRIQSEQNGTSKVVIQLAVIGATECIKQLHRKSHAYQDPRSIEQVDLATKRQVEGEMTKRLDRIAVKATDLSNAALRELKSISDTLTRYPHIFSKKEREQFFRAAEPTMEFVREVHAALRSGDETFQFRVPQLTDYFLVHPFCRGEKRESVTIDGYLEAAGRKMNTQYPKALKLPDEQIETEARRMVEKLEWASDQSVRSFQKSIPAAYRYASELIFYSSDSPDKVRVDSVVEKITSSKETANVLNQLKAFQLQGIIDELEFLHFERKLRPREAGSASRGPQYDSISNADAETQTFYREVFKPYVSDEAWQQVHDIVTEDQLSAAYEIIYGSELDPRLIRLALESKSAYLTSPSALTDRLNIAAQCAESLKAIGQSWEQHESLTDMVLTIEAAHARQQAEREGGSASTDASVEELFQDVTETLQEAGYNAKVVMGLLLKGFFSRGSVFVGENYLRYEYVAGKNVESVLTQGERDQEVHPVLEELLKKNVILSNKGGDVRSLQPHIDKVEDPALRKALSFSLRFLAALKRGELECDLNAMLKEL